MKQFAIGVRRILDSYELSPLQAGMLYHAAGAAEPGVNIEQVVMTLREPLDEAAFLRAWDHLAERHAILRTRFKWQGVTQPLQEVVDRVHIPLERFDWRGLPESPLKKLLQEHRARGFDVTQAPLMRLALARTGEAEHTVLWTFHHLLIDGRSRFMLMQELFAYYEAFAAGRELELERPRPYRDYIDWLRRFDHERAKAYWQRALAGFRAPTPLVVAHESAGSGYATLECRLPAALTAALRGRARAAHITLSVLLQGAWALLLHRYSGEADVVFGVTRAGRSSALEGAATMIGLLINTVPLRLRVDPEAELLTWLAGLREPLRALRDHEHTPLVQVHGWSEVPRGPPLFESLFVFAERTLDTQLRAQGGKWSSRQFRTYAQTNYPLALAAYGDEQLVLQLQYSRRRFADDVVQRMSGHLQTLLEGMAGDPHARLCDLPLLTADERHQLVDAWNASAVAYPQPRCAQELVEEQARTRPEALAVEDGGAQLTYRELDERAERLASRLRGHGVQPDSLVAVYLERSIEMVVALLAVWKAGAAYVPIDREYPAERVRFMLEDTGAPVMLTQKLLAAALPASSATIVHVDIDEPISKSILGSFPSSTDRLAYVIYTSGSTGVPKGVPITHRSLFNLICWHQQAYDVTPADRATQIAGPAFDAALWEIWPYLAAGASVHIPDERTRLDAGLLVRWLAERRITLGFLPTPLAEAALRERWPEASRLRVLLTGGDKLGVPPARALPFRLVNHYGPTENTVVSTCADVPTKGIPPIGRPLPNTQAYVVDRYLQPVPIGVPGELLVGGVQLSPGYWKRADLTAERFIQAFGKRLYRTGDLARWLPDGNIEFLGRIDDQVKIRGFRIELGEIESVIARQPGVREAVVLARDVGGDKRLVAYVVANVDSEELRTMLRATLPTYMVPAHFVRLSRMPLTPNGKLDRKALPAPERIAAAAAEFVAPTTPTERALAELWQHVLRIERIGAKDNFFESGGDSLLAMQLVAGVRERFGVELPLKNLFERPVLADLAEVIDVRSWLARSKAPPARAAGREETLL
jgi:microcystin synthetase protein McyB